MPDGSEPFNRLERLLGRARLIIGFERLWPPLVLAAVIAAVFLALSWLGLWLLLPGWARLLGVGGFAAGLVIAAGLALRARMVSRAQALARLDRDSGLKHRPISASQDRIADAAADPMTLALWDLHRRRLSDAAAKIRLAPPSPRLADRDRFALRGVAVVALVAAAFVAGTDKEGRLAAAFAWRNPAAAGAGFRLDAWIDPPPYTGRAPVMLAGQPGQNASETVQEISVPVHSTVVVRSAGEGRVDVAVEGGLESVHPADAGQGSRPPQASEKRPDTADGERHYGLTGDGRLGVDHDGTRLLSFRLHAIPDLPPTVTLTERPKSNLRGSLSLSYKIDDDYGVVGAEAAFGSPILHGKPITGRTLVDPPKMPLSLPNGARGLGQGQATVDLSSHPWAGAEATLTLSARDEGGNVGRSTPVTVTMPARPFHKPLARALVEQRQALVLDPDHRGPVLDALDALTIAPELFDTTPSIFLGLNSARTRLSDAKTDADLLGVADLLWSMALNIEDGDLSQTERDLRALQRDLRDALARGAPPEEIKKLTEALKQQMEKFLAEMAQKNGEAQNDKMPADRNSKTVTQQDLQSLLDRMEQSARNGDMAEAQQLLDQLQNILENLRTAQRDGSSPGSQQMNRSMSALDKMMRDQQSLRDQTFRRGNRQHQSPRDGQLDDDQDQADPGDDQAQNGDNGGDQSGTAQDNSDLQRQQQAIRRKLDELQKQMRDLGLNGEQGFDDAEQAMKDAENALGKGRPGNDRAVEAQGRALQGLQQGARGLQGQMAQGQGEGDGQQPGQSGIGRADGAGDRNGTDPLGRERKSHNNTLDAQGGMNVGQGLAERARQVLEELRRRLGDRLRPQDEQDYLERLLKRY